MPKPHIRFHVIAGMHGKPLSYYIMYDSVDRNKVLSRGRTSHLRSRDYAMWASLKSLGNNPESLTAPKCLLSVDWLKRLFCKSAPVTPYKEG